MNNETNNGAILGGAITGADAQGSAPQMGMPQTGMGMGVPQAGAGTGIPQAGAPQVGGGQVAERSEKSGVIYLLVMFLLGVGAQDFYLGDIKVGLIKLGLTLGAMVMVPAVFIVVRVIEAGSEMMLLLSGLLAFGMLAAVVIWNLVDLVQLFTGKKLDGKGKVVKL